MDQTAPQGAGWARPVRLEIGITPKNPDSSASFAVSILMERVNSGQAVLAEQGLEFEVAVITPAMEKRLRSPVSSPSWATPIRLEIAITPKNRSSPTSLAVEMLIERAISELARLAEHGVEFDIEVTEVGMERRLRTPLIPNERILAISKQDIRDNEMEAQSDPPLNERPHSPGLLLDRLQFVLGQLAAASAEVDRLQEVAEQVVAEAREEGVTWGQIGAVTGGVTPQTAYQRWSKTGQQKHREYQRKHQQRAE